MSEHGTEAERVTVAALFADGDAARACLRNLQARGVDAILEAAPSPQVVPEASLPSEEASAPSTEAPAPSQASRAPSEGSTGRGVVLGATVGATAGFLAGTYLLPPGAVTATGSMLATLAGAGLGSFFGNLAELGALATGAASATDRPGTAEPGREWLVTARVEQAYTNDVVALIASWRPEDLRVTE